MLGIGLVAPRLGDPDAGRDEDVDPVDLERCSECGLHAAGQPDRLVEIGDVLEQCGELVAAEARRRVLAANAAGQALRGRDQEAIAGLMAQAVVDGLEVVEVQVEDCCSPRPSALALQGVLDPIQEQRPVGKTCQCVMECLMAKLLLELAPIGDVGQEAIPVQKRTVGPVAG